MYYYDAKGVAGFKSDCDDEGFPQLKKKEGSSDIMHIGKMILFDTSGSIKNPFLFYFPFYIIHVHSLYILVLKLHVA